MNQISQNKTLFIVEGILFILLGILAIALPGIMTIGTEIFIGWLLVIGGIVQAFRTFRASSASAGFWWSLFNALLSIVVGGWLLWHPLAGIVALTILLIAFFFLEGIAKIVYAFYVRPVQGWGWLLLSGVIALAMAAILWSGWPGTALWALGLLVGINMLFFGCSLLTLALSFGNSSKV